MRFLMPSGADYPALKTSWKPDLTAGLTVGIVALPLALAFGASSGVGAEAGLITAIVAGCIAAIFGGSNVQVSGPTGAMVVVLAPIVAEHGAHAIATVSVMAGAIVALAGVLRLGRLVTYIPWPVIEGFSVGIGVIIFAQQIPGALGNPETPEHTNALVAAASSLAHAHWPQALLPLGVALAVVAIMVVLQRVAPRVPASFAAIVVITVAATVFALPLETIGQLPRTLPAPHAPAMDATLLAELAGPACAVAALAAIESLLSARVAASMAPTGPVNADRELWGQGLASLAAGFFGGMPATGAIARTAVNVRAGAQTRCAAIIHAVFLLLVVLVAAPVVSVIPLAALAGVLMVTAARMVSLEALRHAFSMSRSDAAIFLLTAVITVSVDLVVAVLVGIGAAALLLLRRLSQDARIERRALPGTAQPGDEKIALFTIHGALFFGAAERISLTIADTAAVTVAIIKLSDVNLIDSTGATTLAELIDDLRTQNTTVFLVGTRPEHRTLLRQATHATKALSPDAVFYDAAEAVAEARKVNAKLGHQGKNM
ncbi:SulP family inorganic anion transporter [Corynebacterium renale]|uniref:SulP family inorganic anion transporter n=1 Tax=Corynebacterium renale TaxID=1724 RepID=UPI0018D5052E|nr:SulP family inorganic anion transporter [Corynebacterium renale]